MVGYPARGNWLCFAYWSSPTLGLFMPQSFNRLPATDYRLLPIGFVFFRALSAYFSPKPCSNRQLAIISAPCQLGLFRTIGLRPHAGHPGLAPGTANLLIGLHYTRVGQRIGFVRTSGRPNWVRLAQLARVGPRRQVRSSIRNPQSPIRNPQWNDWLCFSRVHVAANRS
jgi:hypothetical protein